MPIKTKIVTDIFCMNNSNGNLCSCDYIVNEDKFLVRASKSCYVKMTNDYFHSRYTIIY